MSLTPNHGRCAESRPVGHVWLDGYEFALRNLQDEPVQADLHRLAAGVSDEGVTPVPPHGADDAPDESKGAVPNSHPAPAADDYVRPGGALMTLTEFLLARIAEDEAVAPVRHLVECYAITRTQLSPCHCGLPARVLAECEAKRAIVGLHPFDGSVAADDPGDDDIPVCSRCDDIPCSTLPILAAVYADHPDYQDEWKP